VPPGSRAAKAEAYKLGIAAVGEDGDTAMQIATILGEHNVKVVPEIAVSRDGSSGMANVMLARIVAAANGDATKRGWGSGLGAREGAWG
jgi:hypothetical protein